MGYGFDTAELEAANKRIAHQERVIQILARQATPLDYCTACRLHGTCRESPSQCAEFAQRVRQTAARAAEQAGQD